MKQYFTMPLSENIAETPEGFLLCSDVAISMAGDFEYGTNEVSTSSTARTVMVHRPKELLHDEVTITSFEGKPVTIDHPSTLVSPETYKGVSVGTVQNVRAVDDKLIADLLITDAEAIQAVKAKQLREVSCGYVSETVEKDGKVYFSSMVGNHVALVKEGRCGSECAVKDERPRMSIKDRLKASLNMFSKTLDEMPADEVGTKDEPTDTATVLAELKASMEELKAMLLAMKPAEMEDGKVIADSKQVVTDADTLAKARVLAPAIADGADLKRRAMDAFIATTDGKAIADKLTGGKALDSIGDTDTLFNAMAELVKVQRNQATAGQLNAQPAAKKVFVNTADKINELNREFWKGK